MSLLKELYKQVKETDVTFKRGRVTQAPGDDGDSMPPVDGGGDDATDLTGDAGDLGDDSSDLEGDDLGDAGGEGEELDVVSFDLPALIKALEWAHQEAQDDEQLHKFAEHLSSGDHIDMDAVESAISSCCGEDGTEDGMGDELGGGEAGDDLSGDELGQDDMGSADDSSVDDMADDLGKSKAPSPAGL